MVIKTGQEEIKLCDIQFKGEMFGSLCCCDLERDSEVEAYTITNHKLDKQQQHAQTQVFLSDSWLLKRHSSKN